MNWHIRRVSCPLFSLWGSCWINGKHCSPSDKGHSRLGLFVWLISHQPTILFSHNKSANSSFLSEQISTSHQPPAKRTGQLKARDRWLMIVA
jgi:hypothetical protein